MPHLRPPVALIVLAAMLVVPAAVPSGADSPAPAGPAAPVDEIDPAAELAAAQATGHTVTLANDWRKPAGSTGFHELPGMRVTMTLAADQGAYLYGRIRIRFPFAQNTSILSAARIQCQPAGQSDFHQNQKSRNMWGGETRNLFDRFIFYPRQAGTYTCTLAARLDAHNRNTNDTDHRAIVERYSGDTGTKLDALWPLTRPGVWGTEAGPVDADFPGAASFAQQTGESPDTGALHIGTSRFGQLPAGTEEFVLDGTFTTAAAATHIRVRIDPSLTMCDTTWTGTCTEYANHTHRRSVFRYKVRVEQLAPDGSVCNPRYWAGGSGFTSDKTQYSGDVTIPRDPHHEPFFWTVPLVPVSTAAGCTREFRIRTALKSIVGTDPIRLEPGLRNWSVVLVYNLADGAAI